MKIKDIMCTNVAYVDRDTDAKTIAEKMASNNCGAIFVGDSSVKDEASGEQGKLLGCITDRDITVKVVAAGKDPSSTKAKDIMHGPLLYCFDDQNAAEITENMNDKNVLRFVVVNRDKKLVGVISHSDLADAAIKNAGKTSEFYEQVTKLASKHTTGKQRKAA